MARSLEQFYCSARTARRNKTVHPLIATINIVKARHSSNHDTCFTNAVFNTDFASGMSLSLLSDFFENRCLELSSYCFEIKVDLCFNMGSFSDL